MTSAGAVVGEAWIGSAGERGGPRVDPERAQHARVGAQVDQAEPGQRPTEQRGQDGAVQARPIVGLFEVQRRLAASFGQLPVQAIERLGRPDASTLRQRVLGSSGRAS